MERRQKHCCGGIPDLCMQCSFKRHFLRETHNTSMVILCLGYLLWLMAKQGMRAASVMMDDFFLPSCLCCLL